MQPYQIGILVYLFVFGGAMFGVYVRAVLPKSHLSPEAKDVISLGTGLVRALTMLILAMVRSSAKGSFEFHNDEIKYLAAKVLVLERTGIDYAPATRGIGESLRRGLARRLDPTWPETGSWVPRLQSSASNSPPEQLASKIRKLSAQSDIQRGLQPQALRLAEEFLKKGWILLGGMVTSVLRPFLIIVVGWLVLIFPSIGLYAPPIATAITVLVVSAVSVAGSALLILELGTPPTGFLKISGAPLRDALSQLRP